MRAATFFDGEGWREGVVVLDGERMLLRDEPAASDVPRLDGMIVGGFTDHHVHLQLVEHERPAGSRLGRVVDLGGDPGVVASYASAARIDFAGAFLTPVGGYPSDRSWTPAGSFREIASPGDAVAAVAEMADAGASCIKVASNSSAGPVFDDIVFRVVVEAAGARGLTVVAHAEGRGEAQRVARLGAATLAHAPFTERLTDDEIAEQAASVCWISTLAIHAEADLHVALDNVRRFHAAGGAVRYGTDMGNGPTPVDVNPLEVAALRDAGLDDIALLRALAPADPRDPASVLLVLPHRGADPTLARPLTPADLEA
ncbi:amidohydrolase family protein [Microbacterium hydrocarbonoxydans]|uniref:amidohydrolase family protein n=1 Tax=Microbacterium hydrocarbonoxydans TaxID=273678 RepID=UPI00203AEB86|nr:hydrolase [Microbacterium hydrocarbonoxydans]MCM3779767.1 hydrolase [Microbacterium hydrocarbonoxydans]